MTQTPFLSFIEAGTNVIVGYTLAIATQMVVFPVYGLTVAFNDSLRIGLAFTLVSLARGLTMRRIFNRIGSRG